jgi:FkbM family methyltransferase
MALTRIKREIAHLWRKLSGEKARARAAAFSAFDACLANLGPGKLAIDLGANVGIFTERMAKTGADIIAFEPDPHAAQLLSRRLSSYSKVRLIAAAAGVEAGSFQLYRHRDFDASPDRRTTSSSLIAGKRNVGTANSLTVEVIDFAAFLRELDRDVTLLKIDIEGAEVALLERLLPDPIAARVDAIFVETHERILPNLAARTAALKTSADGRAKPIINWDWH